jgi:outer membrane protein
VSSKLLTIVVSLLAGTSSATALAEPKQTFTLEQAVDAALSQNPRLQAARRQANAGRDSASSVRGRLLPLVKLGFAYDYVKANEGLNLAGLTGGSAAAAGQAPPPYNINFWGGDFNVTVAQPILGLLHTSQDFAAADRSADASEADLAGNEDELRMQVELGLLTLFEARAEQGIAKASEEQLNEQLEVAKAKFKDGALTKADVLRFQVAAANAAQQVIQAQVQDETAKDQLLGLLGLGGEDPATIEFADPTEDLGRRPVPQATGAEQAAETHRPELISATRTADAAWHKKQSDYFKLLPDFNVAYSYYRLINVPSAFPTDINLFGLSASWNVWEWGASYYQARAASEQLEAATDQRESVRQQVDIEVRTRAAQERAAASAVSVASDTIAQAEEAFRVTQATVKAGAATTTDLLDAQSALTQAKLNLVRARYEELRARSSLFRALGSGRS